MLTGGGTAGHVCAHLALINHLTRDQWQVIYLGTRGLEKKLVGGYDQVLFRCITAGKLRRYFSWQNFGDIFRTLWGVVVSFRWMIQNRPCVLLSRGGYVSFPPTVAAWCLRVPVVLIEADVSPGLAVKLSRPFLAQIFYAFSETASFLPGSHVSLPLREEVLTGERSHALSLCGWSQPPSLPVLLVMGGSSGAHFFQQLIGAALESLLQHFYVIYLGGTSGASSVERCWRELTKKNSQLPGKLKSFPYVLEDMGHLYELCDYALSRGGANSLFELMAWGVATLVVPLEKGSRGEQLENAQALEKQGLIKLAREHELRSSDVLLKKLVALVEDEESLRREMLRRKQWFCGGTAEVLKCVGEYAPQ